MRLRSQPAVHEWDLCEISVNSSLMFSAHVDLNPVIQGWEILSWSVGSSGEEIDLLLVEDAAKVRGLRYTLGASTGYNARWLHAGEHYHWELNLRLTRAYHYLCGLTTERFVILTDGQPNAFLFDNAGNELASFWVGDYVVHLQADPAGNLWVSYFDQGFGQDYSERGLSCYDSQGQAVAPFWYCPMMDCYAMNVCKDGIWHCGYTDFPIVHVGFDHRQRTWSNQVRGAGAIVGWGQRVALYGGYNERALHLTILKRTGKGQAVVGGSASLGCQKVRTFRRLRAEALTFTPSTRESGIAWTPASSGRGADEGSANRPGMKYPALIFLATLTCAGCSPKAPPPVTAQNATLSIKATPYDTEVLVNGEKRGKTPLSLKVRPEMLYAVSPVSDPALRKEVTFGYADTSTKEVTLELPAPLILLNRIPPKAVIKLDGKVIKPGGPTDSANVEAPIGKHKLEVTAPKFTWAQQFTLSPEKPKISFTVKPLQLGAVRVTGPAQARVFVNDVEYGLAPITVANVLPGLTDVRVQLKSGKPRRKSIQVGPGRTVAVDLNGGADRWLPLSDGFSYEEHSLYRERPGMVEVWLRGPMKVEGGAALGEAEVEFDMNARTFTRSDVPNFGVQPIPAGSVWERIGSALSR